MVMVEFGPLLKVGMAVDNDDLFVIRVRAACSLSGVEYSREVGLRVASFVTDQIDVLEGPSVSTVRVDDLRIIEALKRVNVDADTDGLGDRFAQSGVADGTTVNTFGVSDEDIVDAVTAFVEVEPPLED